MDSIAQGDVELGNLPIIDDISIRGSLKLVFIMLNTVVEPFNLIFKVTHFNGSLCLSLHDGAEEPISDGSEDAWVKLGMGSKG